MDNSPVPTKLTQISAQYGDLTVIRAIIQAIPYVGGPLDTLLSNGGQKWKMERTEHFLLVLDEKMRGIGCLKGTLASSLGRDFSFRKVISSFSL